MYLPAAAGTVQGHPHTASTLAASLTRLKNKNLTSFGTCTASTDATGLLYSEKSN
jgi:hypothetical protein